MAINTGHGFDLGQPIGVTITDDPLGVRHDRELARAVDLLTSLEPSSEATEMSHRICDQGVAPTLQAMMSSAEAQAKKMIDTMAVTMFSDASLDWGLPVFISIDPVSGLDVRNVDIWSDQSDPVDDVSPAMAHSENILVCDLRSQRAVDALRAEITAKDARIAELKSELALRPAAFVDPDEKPEHNPFREFTKDRRMMGP